MSSAGCADLEGAAALAQPLVARNDILTVLPGPLPDDELRARIEASQTVSIMKVGRHLPRLRALIQDMGLLDQAQYVARASMPQQVTCPLVDAPEKAPYFSMILLTNGQDPWLS